MAENETYMRRAIELARNGEGWTNPNPLVGAVIIKDGTIIGEGWHHKYGELHAEREALKDCRERGNDASGADIFVTLEPCCHFGKQPPCTQAIIEAGIKRVFVGSRDPNPLVHGKGNAFLRQNGVEVIEDFLRNECDALNPIFFHYITTKTPYVALKYAMTADGKIATKTGASKWITGESARAYVHELRNRYAAILCGIGTVLADNPMLNCRMKGGKNPLRVICDSKLRIPLDCQLVKTAKEIPTIVVCNDKADFAKRSSLEQAGLEVLCLPCGNAGKIDLSTIMHILGERKIDSVLIEGGGEINFSALSAGIVNKIYAFIAPKLFGGAAAKSPVTGEGIASVKKAFLFKLTKIRQFEDDLLIEYEK